MGCKDKRTQDAVECMDSPDSEVSPQELLQVDENVLSDSEVIRQTQKFWSKRGFKLSTLECQEAIENMSGFFAILDGWQRQSKN